MSKKELDVIGGESPTNGAKEFIEFSVPYTVRVAIQGTADYLYHRWNNESVAEKTAAKKGSKAKKTDDVESFVYRSEEGILSIPGEQLRMSIVYAAKYRQDPRSSRKSAMDLYKAGIIVLTDLSPTGSKEWDYMDMRRVVIQRASVTRSRPALKKGWKVEFDIMVNIYTM
jgi:hypothetical protein